MLDFPQYINFMFSKDFSIFEKKSFRNIELYIYTSFEETPKYLPSSF
jgi:hypothetical protein